MIERNFDIPFVAQLALREKQIQQNYRPIIGVHKWFARRPGTLFRGLILSEFTDAPLRDAYYRSHSLAGKTIADPFMGGGTPLLEANRLGCATVGYDINPMAWWIVRQELAALDLDAYATAAAGLRRSLEGEVGRLYRTRCTVCGNTEAHVKYFLWVKVHTCDGCGENIDLFPGHLLATDARHTANVFVCHACGELSETADRSAPGPCRHCGVDLGSGSLAKRGRIACLKCGKTNGYGKSGSTPPRHRLFAIEYHCPCCKGSHAGRFFKKPCADDLNRAGAAESRWADETARFVPDETIPSGDESSRLHRWGYHRYREMFNARQLLGLELSARHIHDLPAGAVKEALATNFSDLLRYQNMLCRYDAMALKSLDIFSVHGFPVGLIQCESNLLGIQEGVGQACIGSGGWANVIEKYVKAKSYCAAPFEMRVQGKRKTRVAIAGERIAARFNCADGPGASARIACQDGSSAEIPPASLDGVFTDPPYSGNVQYAELMDFCYVWLRRLLNDEYPEFASASTRNVAELTVNDDMGRDLGHFATGMSATFRQMATALKPTAPLAFTYHHNDLDAYLPLAVAMLDAGLTCSASLPCPAEMGASIHIAGTGSSIVDTVFVCRRHGRMPRRWLPSDARGLSLLVRADVLSLQAADIEPSPGDIRCIAYGHLLRLAVWHLRSGWLTDRPIDAKLADVAGWLDSFGGWAAVKQALVPEQASPFPAANLSLFQPLADYETEDEISF